MEWKYINTNGISYIQPLNGDTDWYWGMDYTNGDLYEAEELYQKQNSIVSNRLIFIKYPEGMIYEPIKAKKGQYLGIPISYRKTIYCLLVDFIEKKIVIYECSKRMDTVLIYTIVGLKEVKDCYNLILAEEPFMLIRQGYENVFQVLWPEKISFTIDKTESFIYRDGNRLFFSKWYEDPAYREEIIVREYATGKILEHICGTLMEMPDGQKWILK